MSKKLSKKAKLRQLGEGILRYRDTGTLQKPRQRTEVVRPNPHYLHLRPEAEVLNRTQLAIKAAGFFVIRRTVGTFLRPYTAGQVTVGHPGEADLMVLLPGCIYCGIEVKAGGGGRLSTEQIAFRRMIRKMGGYYIAVCHEREALDFLEQFQEEDPELPGMKMRIRTVNNG